MGWGKFLVSPIATIRASGLGVFFQMGFHLHGLGGNFGESHRHYPGIGPGSAFSDFFFFNVHVSEISLR